jgi:hypothetical protein
LPSDIDVVCVLSLDDAVRYINVATQTVGFYPFDRMVDYRDRLASGGTQRIVHLGEAGPSTTGNPHDAMYALHRLRSLNGERRRCRVSNQPASVALSMTKR